MVRLILGHLPEFKQQKNPSLSNCKQFAALQEMQLKSLGLGGSEPAGDALFDGEDEEASGGEKGAEATKKNTTNAKSALARTSKVCSIDLDGVNVELKTPQSFKESDICVKMDPLQLGAVCEFVLKDVVDCFGQKRSYTKCTEPGKTAKKAKLGK